MRKSLSLVTLAVALASGNAMADQATVDALAAQGVVLAPEHQAAIADAEGEALVNAVAAAIAAHPDQATAIFAAAAAANPAHAQAIASAASAAAPAQAAAVQAALAAHQANVAAAAQSGVGATSSGNKTNSASIPTSSGGGGSGTTPASPSKQQP